MKKYIKIIIMSIISTIAIFVDYKVLSNYNFKSFVNFYHLKTFEMGVLSVLLFLLYKKGEKKKNLKPRKYLAIILTICMVVGTIYGNDMYIEKVFSSFAYVILLVLKSLGYYYLINESLKYLDYLDITKIKNVKFKNKYILWYLDKISNYPFVTSFITLFSILIIYFIAFYPMVLSPDPSYQILQYFNIPTKYIDWSVQLDSNVFMTTHHPVLQTFFIGGSIEIGRILGSDNLGLFIYVLIQSVAYIGVLSYTISFMIKNKVSNKISLIILVGYIVIPMYLFYSLCAVKDTFYTLIMILLCLFIFDYIKNYKDKKLEISKVAYFSFLMFALCIFRNNGIHILYLTIPFILFYNKENLIKILCAFLVMFGSLKCFNDVFVPSMGISKGSIKEALSIPIQQTARYSKYHSDDLDMSERKAIDKILGYENLVNYDPNLSDPIKDNFKSDYTKEELMDYFKVWLSCLYRHPVTYLDATLNNTYGYFYPSIHNWYLYYNHNKTVKNYGVIDTHFNKLLFLRGLFVNYGNLFAYIPFIGLIVSIGFNTWILFTETALLFEKKKYRYLICLLPLYATILVCFLGPANTYFRYAIPYMFVIPSLFMLINEEEK